jgi:phosphoribosyl 1,2-cyclic phosphate phosphodiesterase
MKITLLGTGDAIGTPKIGCTCPQCTQARCAGLMRLRTSLLVENDGYHIMIDTSPDLRQQLLMNGAPHIDAVIWTHGHYDHFIGFGEFYRIQEIPPVYAAPPVLSYCSEFFKFLPFKKHFLQPYETIRIFGLSITPFEVRHPPAYTCGMLIETGNTRVAYTSDTNIKIPEQSLDLLTDLDLLFLDALVPSDTRIDKHMNYLDACTLAGRLAPKDYRCVHQSHLIPWDLPHQGGDRETFTLP